MKIFTLLMLIVFSGVASAHTHKHHYKHYGYGYNNFFFVPGKVTSTHRHYTNRGYVRHKVYPAVRYQPYRTYQGYYYLGGDDYRGRVR